MKFYSEEPSPRGTTPPNRDGGATDRRNFLKSGIASGLSAAILARSASANGTGLVEALGAPPMGKRRGRKVTVVLFQRGGADHLNLYAPVGDAQYRSLRPSIGLDAPGSNPSGSGIGLPMDAMFAMHPSMPGLHSAFTTAGSSLAVVHAVGYQPYERSHFVSQDLYETALAGGAEADGWINRHLRTSASPQDGPVRALALGDSLPRSMWGSYPCYSAASTRDLVFAGQPDMRAVHETIVRRSRVRAPRAKDLAYQSQRDSFDLIELFAGLDPVAYAPANGAAYPSSKLGQSLRETAEVIKADLGVEFFAVDQGGWDHHSSLIPRLDANAAELDQAITAFFTDLGLQSADVVLVTMSEFGREAAENGSGGTDHGVGGAMLIAGGSVNGGQVLGSWPGLAPTALQSGRFLAPANDFRDVLREILDTHMGGTDASAVFPGRAYTPLGVL